MKDDKKIKNGVLACICALVYLVLIWNAVPFVYGIIDDRSMMEFLSGQYLGTPDAHAIFMGYWYSLFLSCLYKIIPNVDWYALGFMILQWICMSLICYRILNIKTDQKKKIFYLASTLLLFFVLGIQALTQLTFTTTAVVLGVTVIIWYMTSDRIRFRDWLLLLVLCLLTEQVRSSVFYMILPVCGILWLFRLREEHGRDRWHLMIPVAVIIVFTAELAGSQAGYGSPEWKAYLEYNDHRSAVYDYADYTFHPYEETEEFYNRIGIEKKSRARTLMNYNYTADDRITPEFFGEYIASYEQEFSTGETVSDKVQECVKEYLKRLVSGKFFWQHFAGLFLYGGLLIWYLMKKEWVALLKTLFLLDVQGVMWLCLLYAGRVPERVIYSLNLMLVVTGLLLWLEVYSSLRISDKVCKMAMTAVVILLVSISGMQYLEIRKENMEMHHRNEAVESLKQYCMEHPKNFYFNDVTSLAFTTYNVRLWQEEPYQMNYMSLGDWMSYSPLWQEKLKQKGIASVKEALYESDDVYLICDFDKGLEYLIKLYDGVECTEVDKVAGFSIYQLRCNPGN